MNRYVIGAEVLGSGPEIVVQRSWWEKSALMIATLAALATLIEVTFNVHLHRHRRS